MSFSPSKLDDAASCIRRFAWDQVDPLPYQQGPEAALGDLIHLVGEDYHVRGKAPDPSTLAGKLFMPALAFVPRPKVGTAEGKFDLTVSGLDFTGKIDLTCRSDDLPGAPPGMPAVLDYKSVKGLTKDKMLGVARGEISHERWLELNKPAFLENRQALVYAAKALVKSKAERVFLRWIYIRRAAELTPTGEWKASGLPKAEARDCVLELREVVEAFGRLVHPLTVQLVQIRLNKPDPKSLPPNPNRCMLYGKKYACPRIAQCDLDPDASLAGLNEENALDLLEELENEERQAPAPARPEPKPAPAKAKGINPEPLAKPAPAVAPAPVVHKTTVTSELSLDEAAHFGASVYTVLKTIARAFGRG